MRAALIMANVIDSEDECAQALRRLSDAGVQPVVLTSEGAETSLPDTVPALPVGLGDGEPLEPGEQPEAILRAARIAGAAPTECFLVTRRTDEIGPALTAGCRPVLVLGDRSLDGLLGAYEPEEKGFAAALDVATAAGYMIDEANRDRQLGPFPFGPHHGLEERSLALMPTTGDLAKVFAVVIVAGVAASLGIAYLLQELYQTYTFPTVAYWITLQFIPQTWRGVLFLLIGAGGVLVAQSILRRIPRRRRPA